LCYKCVTKYDKRISKKDFTTKELGRKNMGKRKGKTSRKQNTQKPALKKLEIKAHEKTKVDVDKKINVKDLKLDKGNRKSTLQIERPLKTQAIQRKQQEPQSSETKLIDFNAFKEKIDFQKLKHNKRFVGGVAAMMVVCLTLGFYAKAEYDKRAAHELATRGVEVVVSGKSIGVVRNKEAAEQVVNELESSLEKEYGAKTLLKDEVAFVDTHAEDEDLLSIIDLGRKIESVADINVEAFGIMVNGKKLGYVKSEEETVKLIDDLEKPFVESLNKSGAKIKKVETLESISFVSEEVKVSEVSSYDDMLAYLQKGTTEEKTHVAESGDSYWAIAKKYGITVENLIAANPGHNPELIQIGDEINLVVPKPYVSIVTYEEAKLTEKMPFEVEYKKTSTLFSDEQRVQTKGVYGEREIVADVKKVNGLVVDRNILEENVLKAPKTQIVAKGTRPVPASKGTGKFLRPISGKISSRYGYRTVYGRSNFHSGVDIANRIGTPVKAADGGVVTFAGWKGSYGYMVEIDHGGGFKTRYAHNSKIYVKVGQRVYQGKTISAVGNTGRSTGPHVHFEVLKYGKTQNPESYIYKKYR
jgi:murein DD-endopeptidase MepM/ murein hydrolase activator NlpD